MDGETILLLGHGSRDPGAIREFEAFTEFFKRRTGRSLVFPAYLELASPDIPEAIRRVVESGSLKIFALPLFLFPGRHVLEDLPRILADARQDHPGVEFFLGAPLDRHTPVLELAAVRIGEAPPLRTSSGKSGLLVVGRGTLEPRAMEATERMALRLAETLPHRVVRHCFAEVVPPYIPDAFEALLSEGVEAVVIFPALLFTGIILQRIGRQVEALREKHPEIAITLAPHLGIHNLLADGVRAQLAYCKPV
ncbi:MAG TPA: sirohydrochlorin chelatase [Nitrospiria bacterium]|nr:sirohydrochlorin chelatase [Nitrospiria bacterium]